MVDDLGRRSEGRRQERGETAGLASGLPDQGSTLRLPNTRSWTIAIFSDRSASTICE